MSILKRVYHKVKRILGFEKPSRRAKTWDKNVHEKLRYIYDLKEESIVFDLGGYEGQWASDIFSMYIPYIYIFEPIKKFSEDISERFRHNKKIQSFGFGLGGKDEQISISLLANSSSAFKVTSDMETGHIRKANDFLKEHDISHIDLMKINIEGGEYDLLEHLIATGFVKNIHDIQIQFHDFVPNARERMEAIQRDLKKTHHTTYDHEFVWENWQRNGA
jgi:FkbM family methyltransferase